MNKTLKRIFLLLVVVTAAAVLFSFSAAAILRGDVDGDGKVTSADARMALRMSVKLDKSDADAEEKDSYTDREKEIADMDMNCSVSPEDARSILRSSVGLEVPHAFYEHTVIEAPTCTKAGLYKWTTTDESITYDEPIVEKEVPALGHEFTEFVEYTVKPTCTTKGTTVYKCVRCEETKTVSGYAEHDWTAATCTTPKTCKVCGLTSGQALGHTTKLGICANCKQYQSELLGHYNTKIRGPLNSAVKELKNAAAILTKDVEDATATDAATETDAAAAAREKFEKAKDYIRDSHNYFVRAYNACENYPEFAEAREVIRTIYESVLTIYRTGDITAENQKEVQSNWKKILDGILNVDTGSIYALRKITETYKDPGTSAPVTDPEPSTDPQPSTDPEPSTDPGPSTDPEPSTDPTETSETIDPDTVMG